MTALTRGRDVPSARFRVRQYVEPLRAFGVQLKERAPRRPAHRLVGRGKPGAFVQALATRLPAIAATHRSDVTLLQRELVSTRRTLEGWTKTPRVLDVDDAVFLKRQGSAGPEVGRIARSCRMVLAGNRFLADWFSEWCDDVRVVPTTVDTARFRPLHGPPQPPAQEAMAAEASPVIGWIGTAANAGNLAAIQRPLAKVLRAHPGARLRVVAERPPELPGIPAGKWEFVPWSAATEVDLLRSFTVGLMPLDDTPWNRGKCGFKLLQYLAVGVPAVASPVGVNADILDAGGGLAAADGDGWKGALDRMLADATLRRAMATEGRILVERHYSVTAIAPKLAGNLRDASR